MESTTDTSISLDTNTPLKLCLQSQSTKHDEKYFVVQNQTSNFDEKNVNKSDIAIYTNRETINVDKETTTNNQKQNKECITVSNQQINQRHTDDIIETTISNTINNAELPRNDNRIIETSKKNGTEDNNDQEKRKVNNPKQHETSLYLGR